MLSRVMSRLPCQSHEIQFLDVHFRHLDCLICENLSLLQSIAPPLLAILLSLAGGVHAKWQSANIVAPIVIRFLSIPAFICWKLSRLEPSAALSVNL